MKAGTIDLKLHLSPHLLLAPPSHGGGSRPAATTGTSAARANGKPARASGASSLPRLDLAETRPGLMERCLFCLVAVGAAGAMASLLVEATEFMNHWSTFTRLVEHVLS